MLYTLIVCTLHTPTLLIRVYLVHDTSSRGLVWIVVAIVMGFGSVGQLVTSFFSRLFL